MGGTSFKLYQFTADYSYSALRTMSECKRCVSLLTVKSMPVNASSRETCRQSSDSESVCKAGSLPSSHVLGSAQDTADRCCYNHVDPENESTVKYDLFVSGVSLF